MFITFAFFGCVAAVLVVCVLIPLVMKNASDVPEQACKHYQLDIHPQLAEVYIYKNRVGVSLNSSQIAPYFYASNLRSVRKFLNEQPEGYRFLVSKLGGNAKLRICTKDTVRCSIADLSNPCAW